MRKSYAFFLLLSLLLATNDALAQPSATTPSSSPTPYFLNKALKNEGCRHWVDSVMTRLTLREKVGQLFIYTIAPQETKQNLALLHEVVSNYKVGGLLFSGGKLPNQVILTNRAQREAKVPLMITFDGEWGLAMRLRGTPSFPRNRVLGCIQDKRLLYEYGQEVARQCRQLGVQVNFAPDVDVDNNPHNPVINTRSFGEIPKQVAYKAVAYASGLETGGVLSVSKHFPGHGDTEVDSHKALPRLPFDRSRLDSIELLPFRKVIAAGMGSIMVGHLQVPALEAEGTPASLSHKIVTGLLKEEMGFGGLVFTDALAMKGVSNQPNVCLQALKAGNDLLLVPRRIKEELATVMAAIHKGELPEEEIDRRCRKVLMFKYALGLRRKQQVQLSGVEQRINTPQTRALIRRLNLAAITILDNKENRLPLPDKVPGIALLEVGKADELARQIGTYTQVARFHLPPRQTAESYARLRDSLSAYRRIVVAVSEKQTEEYRPFFDHFAPTASVTYLFFTPQKSIEAWSDAVARASATILAHTATPEVQRRVADVLFARATADGRLSTSIGSLFKAGAGITLRQGATPAIRPTDVGFSPTLLERIDSIAQAGIRAGAYPGCQVVVLKEGHTVIDKAYGTYSGKGSAAVTPTSLYDLASLTKTTATLLAVMKLYDEGRISLADRIGDFVPFLQNTDKGGITLADLLFHQSGLPPWIPFYQEAIDKESYPGHLFSSRKDARHPLRTGTHTWANPHFSFLKAYVSPTKQGAYNVQIGDDLWLNRSFRGVIEQKISEATLKPKRYVYSDLNFLLLGMMVERLTGRPLEEYLQHEFYGPMGLKRTCFLPLRQFARAEIVPSSDDRFLRKQVLQGFVNDESAAFLGGVAGNAGLFSTAEEVARIYQMLLNGGELEGHRYLSRETCELFTSRVSAISRRGLGFDRPDTKDPERGNCAPGTPAEVYGHTGFTGTCAWADPVNRVVYIFLSNRTYPDVTNRALIRLKIRQQIQGAIYQPPYR